MTGNASEPLAEGAIMAIEVTEESPLQRLVGDVDLIVSLIDFDPGRQAWRDCCSSTHHAGSRCSGNQEKKMDSCFGSHGKIAWGSWPWRLGDGNAHGLSRRRGQAARRNVQKRVPMIIRVNSQRGVAICYPGDVLSRDTLTAALTRVKGDSIFDG